MHKKNAGFALIEVIVAIVILSAVLAGATTLIWSAATAVTGNKNRLTSTYLAQECLELARNARDTAWRKHLVWDCAFTNECPDNAALVQEMMSGEDTIEILSKETNFSRTMTATKTEADSYTITCEVTWPYHGERETISLTEVLTNWRKL